MAGRVVSKNLFNFRLKGVVDPELVEAEKKMMDEFNFDPKEFIEQIKTMKDEEVGTMLEGMMEGMVGSIFGHPVYQEAVGSCEHSELTVDTNHDGEYGVKSLVHTPKGLQGAKDRPCIVYAHGGGAVAGRADQYVPYLSFMAANCGVVVFNVDYRLAPRVRAPSNILDFVAVVKHVASHAAELGVDPARIAIAGESGGGYICAGAAVELARKGDAGMVKLAIPIIPMLSDYCFSDPLAMTKHEAEQSISQAAFWRLIAGDLESRRDDPMVFPGKADRETLTKLPPMILWSSEFDIYYTETVRFAARVREAGRLLEYVCIPGTTHGGGLQAKYAAFGVESEAWRLAIQEYLVK